MKNLSPIITAVLISFFLFSCQQEQREDPSESYVASFTIDDPFHLDHMSQIAFMPDYIKLSDMKESSLIQSLDVPINNIESVDLNMRAYLGNSLTNYLKELDPEASITDLVDHGNYQFTFLVDGTKVYVENLNAGAGSPYSKNQYTSVCVPLFSSNEEDSWGRFMWMRFMYRGGGIEALTEGNHKLEIEMRPYLELDKLLVGDVIANGNITLKMVSEANNVSEEQIKIQPIAPSQDWEIMSSGYNQDYIKSLNNNIVSNVFKDMGSVVVIKDRKILIEEYFNGSSRETLQNTRSVGKTIAGTLIGLAIDKGFLQSVDQPLKDFYTLDAHKHNSKSKGEITIKDLLTMSSTFDGSDMDSESLGNEEVIQNTSNWIDYILDLPVDASKKSRGQWDYFTGGTMLLGNILEKSTPGGLEAFAKEHFFDPLGINNYNWSYDPQGRAHTAGGLELSALDLAKYGQLINDNGLWNNKKIISNSWMEDTKKNFVELPEEANGYYGYLLYSTTISYKGKNHVVYYAAGNGGNKIYIFKDEPIVVVITAQAYNTMHGAVQADKILKNHIIPAIL